MIENAAAILEARPALMALDRDGGWDHETGAGWPNWDMWRSIRLGMTLDLIEASTAYGTSCWRLTDEGMAIRAKLDMGSLA